jgi:hypothetical protein
MRRAMATVFDVNPARRGPNCHGKASISGPRPAKIVVQPADKATRPALKGIRQAIRPMRPAIEVLRAEEKRLRTAIRRNEIALKVMQKAVIVVVSAFKVDREARGVGCGVRKVRSRLDKVCAWRDRV